MIALFARVRPLARLAIALSGLVFYFAVEIGHLFGIPLVLFALVLILPAAAAVSASRRHL